jgi:hypothetical protein
MKDPEKLKQFICDRYLAWPREFFALCGWDDESDHIIEIERRDLPDVQSYVNRIYEAAQTPPPTVFEVRTMQELRALLGLEGDTERP